MENATLGCGPLNIRKSEICRLCMKTHEYYLNVFVSNEELKTSVGKAIEDLLVLKVAKDDNFPKMVCCPCVTKLVEFREFKEMCVNSAREFGSHAPVRQITCPVKNELLTNHLLGEATSGTRSNFVDGESLVPVAPNDSSIDPFALENQSDTKEEYPRDPLGDSDGCGEEDFAETEYNEDASVCSESKPISMDDQGEVKKELEVTEVVGNVESHSGEIIDEGDSSDTGGPILLSDILAVMDMVHRYNNIVGVAEEQEMDSNKFEAGRHGILQSKVPNNPSCDPVREENLQLEYSTAKSIVVDCVPQRRVKNQRKNINFYASSQKFSQLNDRERPVRSQERKQLCHHAENTSSPAEYTCNYCNTRYSEKKSLALHIRRHVDGKKSASMLPEEFSPRFSQNLLVQNRGNFEPVIFETNNISLTQKSSRRKNEKPIVSDLCGKNFKNTDTLTKHSVIHTGVKPFKCNECGKIFTRKSHLNIHLVVHTGVKRFKCMECGKMFTQSSTLNRHSVIHPGVKPFKCNKCGKMFRKSFNLKMHLRIHSGVQTFKCDECGKIFTRKTHLNTHLVVHSGVKRFKCNECGKMFTRSSALIRHTAIHTGVKQLKCNECGKIFNQSFNLRIHSRIHSGVKPFQCNECGKMFTQKGNLKSHSVVHTGVKRYKCDECGKMFTTSSNLKSHSVIHTGVKRFKCNYCGEQFKWRTGLNRHLRTHAVRNPSK